MLGRVDGWTHREPNDDVPHPNSIVSQFRPPVGKEVLELPAGLVDDGEVRDQVNGMMVLQ